MHYIGKRNYLIIKYICALENNHLRVDSMLPKRYSFPRPGHILQIQVNWKTINAVYSKTNAQMHLQLNSSSCLYIVHVHTLEFF